MEPLILLENVWKIYHPGKPQQVIALEDASIKVPEGDFVALMGPSGSGKSTLLHIIGLLDKPTRGTYSFSGTNTRRLSEGRAASLRNSKFGFVFQSFHLLPRLSALANVELPLLYSGDRTYRRDRARKALEYVGLEKRLFHKPNELSGGEQQRVAMARAIVNNPEVILADEPTGNLDAEAGKKVLEHLKNLHTEGKTILLVTHDPHIASYAKRRVSLEHGRITHGGS